MSVAPDLPAEARRFDEYLRSRGISGGVAQWAPLSGGRSATSVKVTFLDGDEEKSAVLHLAATRGPLAGMADVNRQYDLLVALAATGVPSPRPMGFVEAGWLGRDGYLSEYAPGHVPDPWRASGRAFIDARCETIAIELMRRLAEIHAVPVESLPESTRPTMGGEPFGSRERRRWAAVMMASPVFAHDPLLAYADAWLEANVPSREEARLIHGDYRIGNLVFDEDGRITSVLDWELAEIGDPLYDLGTLCSPALEIGGKVAGVGTQEALVGVYEQISGRAVDNDGLAFYRVLGTFKIACLWINASLPDTADLAALRAHFSAVEARPFLARALDLPVKALQPPADAVLVAIARELRRAGGDLSREEARDAVRSCAAILAAHARSAPVGDDDTRAIRGFAEELGARGAMASIECGKPLAALAGIVRIVMSDRTVARNRGDAVHSRLRELLARTSCAVPTLSPPPSDTGSRT